MPTDRDFEALYSNDPGKIRANANLPGQLVYCVTKLSNHAALMEKTRMALEKEYPGFCTGAACDHKHPQHWTWQDFGIPDAWNPVLELITPYCQFSRAEAMKGSEQVVRSFQGGQAMGPEGVGLAPDLTPRNRAQAPATATLMVVAQNGHSAVHEAKKEASLAKRIVGLGGR